MNKIKIHNHLLETNSGWFIKVGGDIPYGKYIANEEKLIFIYDSKQIFVNEDLKLYWTKKGLKFLLEPVGSKITEMINKIVDCLLKPELIIQQNKWNGELEKVKPTFYIYFYDNI